MSRKKSKKRPGRSGNKMGRKAVQRQPARTDTQTPAQETHMANDRLTRLWRFLQCGLSVGWKLVLFAYSAKRLLRAFRNLG